jgi:hypothetical protein
MVRLKFQKRLFHHSSNNLIVALALNVFAKRKNVFYRLIVAL